MRFEGHSPAAGLQGQPKIGDDEEAGIVKSLRGSSTPNSKRVRLVKWLDAVPGLNGGISGSKQRLPGLLRHK